MFAIITPALIVGAIAERMKVQRLLSRHALGCSSLLPARAHDLGRHGLRTACGTLTPRSPRSTSRRHVVHMSSGWSALILA